MQENEPVEKPQAQIDFEKKLEVCRMAGFGVQFYKFSGEMWTVFKDKSEDEAIRKSLLGIAQLGYLSAINDVVSEIRLVKVQAPSLIDRFGKVLR